VRCFSIFAAAGTRFARKGELAKANSVVINIFLFVTTPFVNNFVG
jgi:hypothetical protein